VVTTTPEVQSWAREHGIPCHDTIEAVLTPGSVDVMFSIGNLKVLSGAALRVARIGGINFHDGPLPELGGVNTPAWAILNGAREHGITWHWMTAEPDAGPVIATRRFAVTASESTLTLNTRCFEAGIETFSEVLAALDRGETPATRTGAMPHRMVASTDRPTAGGTIDWTRPAATVSALVRGLDTGPYANPLGLAKALVSGVLLHVPEVAVLDRRSGAPPGTVVAVGDEGVIVATGTEDVRLTQFRTLEGEPVSAREAAARFNCREGDSILVGAGPMARLAAETTRLAAHERWWAAQLARTQPATLPFPEANSAASGQVAEIPFELGALPATRDVAPADAAVAVIVAVLARIRGRSEFTVQYREPALEQLTDGLAPWLAAQVPLHLALRFDATPGDVMGAVHAALDQVRRHLTYATDLAVRTPALRALPHVLSRSLPLAIVVASDPDAVAAVAGSDVTFALHHDGTRGRLLYDTGRLSAATASALADRVGRMARAWVAQPGRSVGTMPILSDAESHRLLVEWNPAAAPVAGDLEDGLHRQAALTPDRVALVCEGDEVTYADLDQQVSRLAHVLQQRGAGPDVRVALLLDRSNEMVTAMLAVLRAGAAYVPLDPSYPPERLQLMLQDSGAALLLGQAQGWTPAGLRVLTFAEAVQLGDACPATPPPCPAGPAHLAYVIYTSGSTGRPKGVMLERRNVASFFLAMDQRLGREPGTWLAVTSISFDISVLELLWTLARGYTVVVHREGRQVAATNEPARRPSVSLFYFASADGNGQDTYRLLLEGARFADTHDFEAVWTPERHFHAFGGIYPNPSVTAAAVASVTERVQVRAGSVVLPLHHPARVAEEWAVVDNLSRGRAGIAFAAGWQPNDFVLRPEVYGDHRAVMQRDVDVVRRLWRGEAIEFPGAQGKPVTVRTLPRPVQPELPTWLTAAGNPDTYIQAGTLGAGVLTHLLGQSVEELGAKLARYRQAWRAAGHPGRGKVTLMLHTFVGDSDASVKEVVREPLRRYLDSSVDLVKEFAATFPALKQARQDKQGEVFDVGALGAREREDLLSYAFERYYETSGLFGTVETCLARVDQLSAIGVDEIACLVDFGIEANVALQHLGHLDQLRQRIGADRSASTPQHTLAAMVARHGVTHLQCTPSLARLLLADPAARAALSALTHVLLGGEAFTDALADELLEVTGSARGRRPQVHNMYGPTETTVWSTMHTVQAGERPVPIGTPLANTRCYVLDARDQLLPPGVPGELHIGGTGVARGYLGLDDLTAQRFPADPFGNGRMYRTGDRVRWRRDGTLEFLGRLDQQVKLSGYRIELGEVEAQVLRHPGVREAVVLAREDRPGDVRLVAYVVFEQPPGDVAQLRGALRRLLPDFMVPATVVALDRLPMTPNGKVNRRALPPPATGTTPVLMPEQRPSNPAEETIAGIWREFLQVSHVSREANFFDLGGHSLLAVQVHRRLQREFPDQGLTITDLFRFPTVGGLAAHLAGGGRPDARLQEVQARGEARRAALQRKARREPR